MTSELQKRIVTALLLLPALLLAIFTLPSDGLYAVFAVVGSLAAWEWAQLAGIQGIGRVAYGVAVAALLALAWWLNVPRLFAAEAFVVWLAAFALVLVFPSQMKEWGDTPRHRTVLLLLGVLLLVPAIVCLVQLRALGSLGVYPLIFLFFLIFAADVGAYFVGKKFGKRKLAPLVSPGKSIEGALGGLACSATLAAVVGPWVFQLQGAQASLLVLLAVVTAVFSIVGDLTESLFKRRMGVKDSSQLLPGHGGVLDRIDSLIAAGPVFYFGLLHLGLAPL